MKPMSAAALIAASLVLCACGYLTSFDGYQYRKPGVSEAEQAKTEEECEARAKTLVALNSAKNRGLQELDPGSLARFVYADCMKKKGYSRI